MKKKVVVVEKNHAKEQAEAQLESIIEMVAKLERSDRDDKTEVAREEILSDPLSVELRSDWHTPGEIGQSTEYKILLCTGGPAVQIIGQLSGDNEPITALLEYQDWGTPWTGLRLTSEQQKSVLIYAQQFYFGE